MISQEQLEKARDRVIRLIDQTKSSLKILVRTKYDSKELEEVCKNWNEASDKLKEAQSIINEIVSQIKDQKF